MFSAALDDLPACKVKYLESPCKVPAVKAEDIQTPTKTVGVDDDLAAEDRV